MKGNRTKQNPQRGAPWRTLEQLAESWGLSRSRTNLVLKALVRSGRMEERCARKSKSLKRQFRLVGG